VVAGHLKSKGSACDGVGDPDLGDGQGNCNATRTAATQALTDWLASDPTKSGDPDFVIIGDMNAYAKEDPVTSLEAAGYVNLVDAHEGSNAYSFVFDGRIGYLDHALANGSMASQVTGVTTWHINSDEIPVLDYNDDVEDPGEASFERESAALPLFDQDAFRSSDHDPVIVGLDLDGAGNM
jgi:predicted extracellular nuclease